MKNSVSPTAFQDLGKDVSRVGLTAEIQRMFMNYAREFGEQDCSILLDSLHAINSKLFA